MSTRSKTIVSAVAVAGVIAALIAHRRRNKSDDALQ